MSAPLFAPGFLDLLGDSLQAVDATSRKHHNRPFLGEQMRRVRSEPGRGARDEYDLIFERHCHNDPNSCAGIFTIFAQKLIS
jgi:hypothetical protein